MEDISKERNGLKPVSPVAAIPAWLSGVEVAVPPSPEPAQSETPEPEPVVVPSERCTWEDALPVEAVEACPVCGSLELWQSVAGSLDGLEPGWWRCLKCEPPNTSRRLRRTVERIRARER